MLQKAGMLLAAVDECAAAVASKPRDPRLHVALARARLHAGDPAGAAVAFRAAIALHGTVPLWHRQLATALAASGDAAGAVAALTAATTMGPPRPHWHRALGQQLFAMGDSTAAADAYAVATAGAPNRVRWRVEEAEAAIAAGLPGRAAQAYRSVAAARPDRLTWGYRLGEALALDGRIDDAREQFKRTLAVDPRAHPHETTLLDRTPQRFLSRQRLLRFVASRLDAVKTGAARRAALAEPAGAGKVFVYWAQGFANAPAVTRLCLEQLQRLHSPTELVVLDESLVRHYVQLPRRVFDKLGEDRTHLADLIRLELLARYGGVWVDATCFVRRPLPAWVDEARAGGFFAFERSPGSLSNWLMAADPGNYIVTMLLEAHHRYWRRFDHVVDYFMFHQLFEALYLLDARFADEWDASPRPVAKPAHALQKYMYDDYDPVRFEQLLSGSDVHKLTHKFRPHRLRPDSLLAHLVRDGLAGP